MVCGLFGRKVTQSVATESKRGLVMFKQKGLACLSPGFVYNDNCTTVKSVCRPDLLSRQPSSRPAVMSMIHSSATLRGLEEFFDDEKNWGQPTVKAGRAWSKDELRLKDYVTLHKLWYVLLKERNMLLTMQTEADRQEKFLPSPERINKVEVSMENVQAVLKERKEALTELETGLKDEHPAELKYTPFGYKRWVKPREYAVPKYMNKFYATRRTWYDPSMGRYLSLWYEQRIRRAAKEKRKKRRQLQSLKKRFPESDIWENKS
ncbi:large ribosomal subunit protein uL29m-like [Diadema antillarum]|uniref:large ribosomal subunit protein uL29m-like n=1 Tax=Diadema antillarum TaxID=105358 RepID=UPI003A835354